MANDNISIAFNGVVDRETLRKELLELDNYFIRFFLKSAEDTSLNNFVSEKHTFIHSLIESM